MKKTFLISAAVFLIGSFAVSQTAFAAGFRLPESSASAMGMSSAFVGQADDPSAVWYNPAGITQLDGTRISAGVVAIYPIMKHENNTVNPGTTDVSERTTHFPFHLYGTHKLNDSVSFGIGINNPFGLSTDWDPQNSSTKYVATYTKMVTAEVNPNVAYKLNNNISIAAGLAYMHLRATLEKTARVVLPGPPPTDLGDHNFRLSGDGDGWGVNAAILYRITDNTTAGLSYRSRIKVDVDGDAELTGGPAATSGSASTSITLPDIIQIGVSYKASDKLTLNGDLEYTWWETYDRLVITSSVPNFNTTDEKQWDNSLVFRIGGQYKLSDQWKLRAGYLYDQNPVPEERFETRVPDSDRQGISIGAGFTSGNLTIDAAYLYLRFNKRTIDSSLSDNDINPLTPDDSLNGTYKTQAHLAGLTIGYKF